MKNRLIHNMVVGLFCLAGNAILAQDAAVEKATLHYSFSAPTAVAAGGITESSGLPVGQIATPSYVPDALLESLIEKLGRKEKKIVRQILKVGVENKLIDLEKIERKLGQINMPAIMALYSDLRSLKINDFDLNKLEKIRGTLADIDAALKKADLKGPDFGRLSFFAGMARDRLAAVAATPAEKGTLRASAMQNYNDTIRALSADSAPASQEKVADAEERIETLRSPFGGIVPISPKKGKGVAVISSDYGTRVHPVKKTRRFHSGVDLAGWKCNGWKVLAVGAGRVVKSGWESGYGYSVVVSHEVEGQQLFSRYAHLMKSSRLAVGKLVKAGDLVGYCNNSGISTGAHLHFEVRNGSPNGDTHDPKTYLPEISQL